MEENRRNFLIKLGSATLFGVGSVAAINKAFTKTVVAEIGEKDENSGKHTRWGMFVDMDKCAADCKDCITACHVQHNVPNFDNPKDEIKWVWKQDFKHTFPSKNQRYLSTKITEKPVLTFCNHCDEPPCVRVCPTQATFRRPDGIVEMDFHRCIGCRFCMAGCPYGSRSFNWLDPRKALDKVNPSYPTREIGVVEKCNFCSDRLPKGQQPACVETCKNKALVFGNLYDENSDIRQVLKKRVTFTRKPELGTKPSVFYAFENGND